ncbi:hypothetical protein [Mycolicibacterium llatzerense]|uniref:hypothetical protein n=1 Tax=Mycolicibacterium llatzerense TaxID=280871 RepID=UPI0013A6B513|nr:hypothetical protein [Mycolicibacterium llatzerense]
MSAPIHQNFPALHASLDSMEGLGRAYQGKVDELRSELNVWAGFWRGTAHDQAMGWSQNVTNQAEHSGDASLNYTATARQAVADMEAQEHTNAGIWT